MHGINDRIISEDFPLTDPIRDQVEQKILSIEAHTKKSFPVKVFLSKEGPDYEVKFLAHVYKIDLEGFARDKDFYVCLNKAKQKFLRVFRDRKEKIIKNRRDLTEIREKDPA